MNAPSSVHDRRLHPLSVLIELVRVLGRMALPLIMFAWLSLTRKSADTSEVLFSAMGLFAVVSAFVKYLTLRFRIEDGLLLIFSGVVTKQRRTIPLDRIQNINITRSWLHRVLGLVDLQIETASGTGAEASLNGLSQAQAEELRRQLLSGHRGAAAIDAPEAEESVIYQASIKELLVAGATQNRAATIVAAIGGMFVLLGQMSGDEASIYRQIFRSVNGSSPLVMALAALGILFFMGWVISIFATLLNYGNFELVLREGKLRRRYGLLNQVESVVPVPRVQSMRFVEPIIQRWMGLGKVFVDTAGSFNEKDMGGSAMLSPLTEFRNLPRLADSVLPGWRDVPLIWKPVDPKSLWSVFRARILWCVLIGGLAGWRFGPEWYGLIAGLLLLAFLTSYLRRRTTHYADLGSVLVSRTGWMQRSTMLVPIERIQAVTWTQTPTQRRYGLATVTVSTASARTDSDTDIRDLSVSDAHALAGSLQSRLIEKVRGPGDGL